MEFELKGNMRDILIDTRRSMRQVCDKLDSMWTKMQELTLDHKQLKQQNQLLSQKVSKLEAERTKLDKGMQQTNNQIVEQSRNGELATGKVSVYAHQ